MAHRALQWPDRHPVMTVTPVTPAE